MKPGRQLMIANVKRDLRTAEAKADHTQRIGDMMRVVALRDELSRLEHGEL